MCLLCADFLTVSLTKTVLCLQLCSKAPTSVIQRVTIQKWTSLIWSESQMKYVFLWVCFCIPCSVYVSWATLKQCSCTVQTRVENLSGLVEIWLCILLSLTENLLCYGIGLLFCCFGFLSAGKFLSSLSWVEFPRFITGRILPSLIHIISVLTKCQNTSETAFVLFWFETDYCTLQILVTFDIRMYMGNCTWVIYDMG